MIKLYEQLKTRFYRCPLCTFMFCPLKSINSADEFTPLISNMP